MSEGAKQGGCHCGAVRWEADTPDGVEVHECNCSICQSVGFLHIIVAGSKFRLLCGEDQLTEYKFNTGVARHYFCKLCGVKSFYIPRSHPDGVSLNLRCMDRAQFESITIVPFDGQHWEESNGKLAQLSQDGG